MRISIVVAFALSMYGIAHGQIKSVPDKLKPLLPDLVAGTPELRPDRTVRFSIINRTSIPVNSPFKVQVYVNGVLKETLTIPSAGGYTSNRQNLSNFTHPDCSPLKLRVVVDSAHEIQENEKRNNNAANSMTSPCPDVTAKIEKNSTDNGMQFKTRVRIMNNGEMTMPAVQVRTLVASSKITEPAQPASACLTNMQLSCGKDSRTVGPLSPGQEAKFNVDPLVWAGITRLHAQVDITCGPPGPMHTPECIESDYANNTVKKGID
jgi:CARDB protein